MSLTSGVLASNWNQIKLFACHSLDYEVISIGKKKLPKKKKKQTFFLFACLIVHTCWNEFEFSGLDIYRLIASKFVRGKVSWKTQIGMFVGKIYNLFSFSSSTFEDEIIQRNALQPDEQELEHLKENNHEEKALIDFKIGTLEIRATKKTLWWSSLSAASVLLFYAFIRLRRTR
jgi:hypothetical protein